MKGDPHQILKQYWGYSDFRPGQESVIQSVLQGKDTLALLPTGAGKSMCYQVPALASEGMTLVISPLIALMKDQVDQLKKRGIAAEAVYAGMPHRQIDRILDNALFGGLKLLYLSPERLHTDLAEARIRQMKVDLIAVDEAHCISQWGYDFRPAYLQVALVREWHPKIPVLALTATAIPEVVMDIQKKLLFRSELVIKTTFRRSNLGFQVSDRQDKELAMLSWVKEGGGSAIVYVRSRRKTQDYALFLRERGIAAQAFHAGLSPEQRMERQEGWQAGKFPVMVATNAFGMGIDKADVRTVVHMDLPDSLEAYYQEAGRAGRDGKPATAILLAGEADILKLEQQFEESFPPLTQVRQVYRALGSFYQLAYGSGEGESFDFELSAFCRQFQLPLIATMAALKILEESGWLSVSESVYQPATLWIKASSTDLYQHQLRQPKVDRLIKIAQRSYQGLHHYPVNIKENELATMLGTNTQEVVKVLLYLDQAGLVEYKPRKEHPQLTFQTSRVDADHLEFDWELLSFRKKRREERMGAIRNYLSSPRCRQAVLMAYFGEETSSICGQCDHCLGEENDKTRGKDKVRIEARLQQLFQDDEGPGLDKIKNYFPREEWVLVRTILQEWSDEGMLRESNGRLIFNA